MDDGQSRDFWERALREIRDDGFFTSVQTAEPPTPTFAQPVLPTKRRCASNVQLILIVLAVAVVLALIVINWLAPALF